MSSRSAVPLPSLAADADDPDAVGSDVFVWRWIGVWSVPFRPKAHENRFV